MDGKDYSSWSSFFPTELFPSYLKQVTDRAIGVKRGHQPVENFSSESVKFEHRIANSVVWTFEEPQIS